MTTTPTPLSSITPMNSSEVMRFHHRGDTSGSIFAGTPIAVKPAGTSLITREFAAIIAPSPIVTLPMMLEWHPMKT
jgi:hypothetical protein